MQRHAFARAYQSAVVLSELLRLDTGCCTALEWVVTGDKAKKSGSTTIGLNPGSMQEFHADVQLGKIHLTAP